MEGLRHRSATACVLLLALALAACRGGAGEESTTDVTRFGGETMGTTYSVQAVGVSADAKTLQAAVDSLLAAINAQVNHYDPASQISAFNRGDTLKGMRGPQGYGEHLHATVQRARTVSRMSGGAFDPTVGPLVNYYGFGPERRGDEAVEQRVVDSLVQLVGFERVTAQMPGLGGPFYATVPGVRLDLSAIAKGYAVDRVSALLAERYGATDSFVEIGGEVVARGYSPRGGPWTVGVNTPEPGASTRDLELVVAVSDAALATSGNYRNARERGGVRYVHTIDPHTGAARPSRLLSATVLAGDCATADAYATAAMATGEDAPRVLANAGLAACLIYAAQDGGEAYDVRYVGEFEAHVLRR